MTIKIGINGFGRIGRLTLRAIQARHKGEIEVVAVNENLSENPDLVNRDAYDEGWLFIVNPSQMEELEDLLDAEAYEARAAEDDH